MDMVQRSVLVVLCLLSFLPSFLVMAKVVVAPDPIKLEQPNGYTFTVIAKGTADHHWLETFDGRVIKKVNNSWYYLGLDKNSNAVVLPSLVGSLSNKALQKVPKAKQVSRSLAATLIPSEPIITIPKSYRTVQLPSGETTYGEQVLTPKLSNSAIASQNILVLLVSFTNQSFTYDASSFNSLIFDDSGVNGFFKANSLNRLVLTPVVESQDVANDGVVAVSLAMNHPNTKFGSTDMVHAAFAAADDFVDYNAFDANSDGSLSTDELSIILIVAGYENSFGGNAALTPRVWGHASGVSSVTHDGVNLSAYTMFGERHATSVSNEHQATIGIMAHELGHLMLGLPDLYDTDGSSDGIGRWGLMGGGSWNRTSEQQSGESPAGLLAWSKIKAGFATAIEVNASQSLSLDPALSSNTFNKVWLDTYKLGEYFLLENRRLNGVDAAIPGQGLLISHIDESQSNNTNDNRRLVDIEEADGEMTSGDDGDTYPGSASISEITGVTTPATTKNSGEQTGMTITGISESGSTISISNVTPVSNLGDNISYNEGRNTSGGAGFGSTSIWTALDVLNTTSFEQVVGFEVYLSQPGSVTFALYDRIDGGVLGASLYSQGGFVGVAGWNRFFLTTGQILPLNSAVVMVLNINLSSSTFPASYNRNDNNASGRSYMASSSSNTFFEISSVWGDLNQHLLLDTAASMSTTFALTQVTDSNLRNCLAALVSKNNLTLVSQLTAADCSNQQISELSGLDLFTALTTLDLSNNQINDIGPLISLQLLASLNLSDNLVSNLGQLAVITTLRTLLLDNNSLTDLSPLLPDFALKLDTLQLLGNDGLPCWQQDYIESFGTVKSWVRSTVCNSISDSDDDDGDGLSNRSELTSGFNPTKVDTDGDGSNDNVDSQPLNNQRWTNIDTDGDSVTDDVEILLGLDINDATDVWSDDDADRLPLLVELQEATDSNAKDNDVFTNNRLLVQQAYVDIKRRFATAAQITFWDDRLQAKSHTPVDVYSALLDDTQLANMGFIGRVYLAIFERGADAGGARYYMDRFKAGVSRQVIIDGFVVSTEFHNKYGSLSNADFVNLVYQNVLGRAADSEGFAFWQAKLDSAQISRGQMMSGFIESVEFINNHDNRMRVDVLSQLLTGSNPSSTNSALYAQWLVDDGNGAGVLKAILASDGFRNSLMATISGAATDTDVDGISDGVEFVEGLDVNVKDNDVNGNDTLFVKQLLRDLVGEASSFKALSDQQTTLSNLGSRADWVKQLLDDNRITIGRQAISRLYFAFFERQPDHSGLLYWIDKYETGMTLAQIAGTFAISNEFQTRYGSLSSGDFVHLVYQNVLGRTADSGGFDFWKTKLDNSELTQGEMMVGFSESTENIGNNHQRGRVVLLFNLFYRRVPTDNEYNHWLAQLNGGTDVGLLIDELLINIEFVRRFY